MSEKDHLLQQLKMQGITHPAVLKAIKEVPRDQFVMPEQKKRAYDNSALPIECHQTISQPYIVATMTQALLRHPHPQKILEIGTGSGYQAAVLAKIFNHVWSIERIEPLYQKAKETLTYLGFNNISFRLGDGYQGWPEEAPFDGIVVTAAPATLPPRLLAQLSPHGGIMVIPIGPVHKVQKLTLIIKQGEKYKEEFLELVSFVPMIEDKQK